MNQIADAAVRGRALDTLAASLLGAGIDAQQFQRLADASNYPNYNHIVEYYQRMPTVVQQWAAEGMRELVANILQQFESAEDIERWIKRTKRTMLLSRNRAPAEMIKLLGNAYLELALRYTDQDVRRAALLDAQSNFQSAAGRDRSDGEVYFLLSSCLNELARLDAAAGNPTEAATRYGEAVAAATQAIALRGDFAEAHVNRAFAYHGQSRTDLAINDLNDALYLDDRLAKAYVQRAVLYTIKGDQASGSEDSAQDYYSRAVADYERAYLTGYSDVAAVWLGIGEASLKRRDYDRAETELSRAIESLNERQLAQAYLLRGTVCRNRGPEGYDAAENDFSQAILRASQAGDTATQVEATFKRGDLRTSMTPPRYPAAIQDFTGVLVLNPGHTAARAQRGIAYKRLGQLAEARPDLEAVLAADPGSSVRFEYANLLESLQEVEAARVEYQHILDADPQGISQEARLSRAALGVLQGTNP
jgi:tetratricopeptide (TPR) repeat protein